MAARQMRGTGYEASAVSQFDSALDLVVDELERELSGDILDICIGDVDKANEFRSNGTIDLLVVTRVPWMQRRRRKFGPTTIDVVIVPLTYLRLQAQRHEDAVV